MKWFGKKRTDNEKQEEKPRGGSSWFLGGETYGEYMAQLEKDLAPGISEKTSLSDAAALEIVSDVDAPGAGLSPEDEAIQHLRISASGNTVFRSVTYFKGKGHYGIGRYEQRHIESAAAQEIFQLLDTWIYTSDLEKWDQAADTGTWLIRADHGEGHAALIRGPLTGAFAAGMDVSWFIRQRIAIPDLYLFDGRGRCEKI